MSWLLQRKIKVQDAYFCPSPQLNNIRIMVIVWRLRENIIRTTLCWIVRHNVHGQQHTYMSIEQFLTGTTDLVSHHGTLTLCVEAVA